MASDQQESNDVSSVLAGLLADWDAYDNPGPCGAVTEMKVYPYKGVDDIVPGANVVLFSGRFADDQPNRDGVSRRDNYTQRSIEGSFITDTKGLRLQSAIPDRHKHRIHLMFTDGKGNRQGMDFDLKLCGKGTVFGHHHRLTVELRDMPTDDNQGKAVSDVTGEDVPFKGPLNKKHLGALVYDWLDDLFGATGSVFYDEDSVLDVLKREKALECLKTAIPLENRIPLSWNPCNSMPSMPQSLKDARDRYMDSSFSVYSRLCYIEEIINRLKAKGDDRVSLESLLEAQVIPCYPVFRVNPHGPGVWDEDREVIFAGVLQNDKENKTHVSNHALCKRIERLTGTFYEPEDLLKAADRCAMHYEPANDVFSTTTVCGCKLYFLGVTLTTRKEQERCAS